MDGRQRHPHVLVAMAISQHAYYAGIGRYAKEHRWHLVTDMIYSGKIPWNWCGDGIITFLGHHPSLLSFVQNATARGIPTVDISVVRSDVDLPRVAADNKMIGRLAAEHLLERDYRQFAWIPFSDDQANVERYEGFIATLGGLKCHSLTPAHRWARAPDLGDDWSARRQRLIDELLELSRPLGVFAYNDALAANAIDACEVAGIKVPEEMAILGVDNDPFIQASTPLPLSSVVHNLEGMAYAGAALLDRLMSGESAETGVLRVPPTGVITRASTDMMAVGHSEVATALRYIAEEYARPLQVGQIVKATGISRRPLEIAFREELGVTINQQLADIRLRHVKRLLRESDLSVAKIAMRTGFTRPNHLFRTFRKHYGISPRQYRLEHAKQAWKESVQPR